MFPDPAAMAKRIVTVDEAYAAAHVSRATTPAQICNYLEVCGEARDPSISFCAAGGSYGVIHAYCDLAGIKYDASNVVEVFKAQIPIVEAHWIRISASCEQVRQWAIDHGKWIDIDYMVDDLVFKPGWVALLNFETSGPEAHHYATISGDPDPDGSHPERDDEVPTVEFNTSDISQGKGGCVATKRRFLSMPEFRGIVRTW
jgi:hypothetical protein